MSREEAIELFTFSWGVPDRGYVWREDAEAEKHLGGVGSPPFLAKHPEAKMEEVTCPIPFDEPGGETVPLFARFANLEPTKEAITTFARTFGWLGVGTEILLNNGELDQGEPLSRWIQEIKDARCAFTLWEWLQEKKGHSVRIEWESGASVRVLVSFQSKISGKQLDFPILYTRKRHGDLFRLFQRENKILPVRAALLQKINEKLRGIASPCLLMNRHGELEGYIRPGNLLAAIWVQLYQAILGQRHWRVCVYCKNILDVTGSRQSKKAHAQCVHNAKMNRYRRAQAKQKRLMRRSR